MRRSSGFSLMEMMIVLLIVAIVAAASAPMVSRKLASESGLASTAYCLWHENGRGSITFNADMNGVPQSEQGRKSVIIGTSAITDKDKNSTEKPRLFIKSNSIKNSHIELEGTDSQGDSKISKMLFFNGSTWFSTKPIDKHAKDSVAIGHEADANKEGSVAIGSNAKAKAYAVAIGSCDYQIANPTEAGQNSIAIGYEASADKEGSVAIGYGAGTDPAGAVALGYGATATQSNSIAIGKSASVKGGDKLHYSIAIGHGINVSSNNSIAIGQGVDISDTAKAKRSDSIVIGHGASTTTKTSVVIGNGARNHKDKSTAFDGGVAVGHGAQALGCSVAMGRDANASGYSSMAIGYMAEASDYSIAIGATGDGAGTLRARATGDESIAIARANATGDGSIAIGGHSEATEWNSQAFGRYAYAKAENSVAIGYGAQVNEEKHKNSVAIGHKAKTTAANQIVLGHTPTSQYDSERTTVYIPGNLVVDGSVILARTADVSGDAKQNVIMKLDVNGAGKNTPQSVMTALQQRPAEVGVRTERNQNTWGWSVVEVSDEHPLGLDFCDRRLKNVGEVFKGGLDEIKKLEVFNYTYKKDKDKTPRVGVMAQDLQKIFPNAVFKGDDGFLRIRMEDMFYALVNAVKELDKKIDLLVEKQKKIDELEKRVDTLEKRLAKLEKQMKEK